MYATIIVTIVLMVLFCFLGPVFYHTNQTSTQAALINSTQSSPPRMSPSHGQDVGLVTNFAVGRELLDLRFDAPYLQLG